MKAVMTLAVIALLLSCNDRGNNGSKAPFEGQYIGTLILGCPTCAQAITDPLQRALSMNFSNTRFFYSLQTAAGPAVSGAGEFFVKKDSVRFVMDLQMPTTIEVASIEGTFSFDFANERLTLHRAFGGDFYQDIVLTRTNE